MNAAPGGRSSDHSLVPVISLNVRSIHRPRLHFAFEGEFGVSNGKGEFLIPDLFADDYELIAVRRLPRAFYIKNVTQGGHDVKRDSIRPGDDVTVTLASDGPDINGHTVDMDGRTVHDATVILIPKDQWHGSIVSLRSGGDGQFHIDSGIAPGEYSILALAGLIGGEEQDPDFIRDQAIRATPLVLDKNETKSITLLVHYVAH
jgi:hypothetical protein